jgi:hypothetical protein
MALPFMAERRWAREKARLHDFIARVSYLFLEWFLSF